MVATAIPLSRSPVYPQLVLNNPTRSVSRGIVESAHQLFLPVEGSTRIGPIRISGEIGYWFTGKEVANSWVRALIVGHEFGKKTEFYLELYDQADVGLGAGIAEPAADPTAQHTIAATALSPPGALTRQSTQAEVLGPGATSAGTVPAITNPIPAPNGQIASSGGTSGTPIIPSGASSGTVGIVLDAAAGATLTHANQETAVAARAGALLYPGDRLMAGSGLLRFAFCPQRVAATLSAGAQIQLPAGSLAASAGMSLTPVEFCSLPQVPQNAPAISASPTLPAMDSAAVANALPEAGRAELATIDAALARNPSDLLARLARAQLFGRFGATNAALAEYANLKKQVALPWVDRAMSEVIARGAPVLPRLPAPKTWALVVGISRYASRNVSPLNFADRDAQLLARFLATPRGGDLSPETIVLLTNQQATTAAVRYRLADLIRQIEPQDTLLIYLSGHALGQTPPQSGSNLTYLLTYDADPEDLRATAISALDLRTALDGARSARTLVFLDLCYMSLGGYLTGSARTSNYFELDAAQPGGWAFEDNSLQQGFFSYYLVRGLNGAADQNADGVVSSRELAQYVSLNVTKGTAGKQDPRSYSTGDMPLTDVRKSGIVLPEAAPGWGTLTQR